MRPAKGIAPAQRKDSLLSNFTRVAVATSLRREEIRAHAPVGTPRIMQSISPTATPQAEAFNSEALCGQHAFALNLLKGKL